MTQTIEQLTARVRELEEEVKAQKTLREESQDHHRACIIEAYKQLGIYEGEDDEFRFKWVSLEIHRLNEKLAASKLHAEQLRVALNAWIGIASNCSIESGCCCCGESMENHSSPMMCGHSPVDMADSVVRSAIQKTDEALSIPHDTSALDAYVAEKVKEATEKLHYRMEHCYSIDGMKAILDLDEMTRQRDLAVEAASDAATSLETIQLRSFKKNYLNSKPQMREFAGVRAKIARYIISTIKESEAMAQGEKK